MTKQFVRMRLAEITPYENNPRHNDNAVEAVKESIRQCEYIAPIVVDEDNVILAGHTRAKALAELGKASADVMVVSGLTDEQKRKYRLLDNKTNELAVWDIDLLEIELEDLDFEGFDFGFGVEELTEPLALDDNTEKTKVNVTIVFDDEYTFREAEERLNNIADELHANLSYKMV